VELPTPKRALPSGLRLILETPTRKFRDEQHNDYLTLYCTQPSEGSMNITSKHDTAATRLVALGAGRPRVGGEQASTPHQEGTGVSRQVVPSSSLYLQPLRPSVHIAVEFAELPFVARFICIFEVHLSWSNTKEMHI
jgi:hypothetical protein